MKKIGVYANLKIEEMPEVLRRLAATAARLKISVRAPADTARWMPGARTTPLSRVAVGVDALVALGGDGTMLRAVRLLERTQTPVLGVNLGNLGFLTSITVDDLDRAFEALVSEDYQILSRTTMDCTLIRKGKTVGRYRALNDVVIGWGHSTHINMFNVSVNNEHVTSYRCDGIIVSTPTGSTGHSLSAGGPILHPATPALLLNVICPHALSARPLVLPDQSRITLDVSETPKRLLLSVDGQEVQLVRKGDRVNIARSEQTARFIHLPDYSYFPILRLKLDWRGSSVT